ncbi:MAG TPA: hypothetical protein VGC03_17445 [Acidimicrobiia bacterium]
MGLSHYSDKGPELADHEPTLVDSMATPDYSSRAQTRNRSRDETMPTSSVRETTPIWWRIHDVVVGFLSGFGVGTVAGLFLNRLFEENVVVLITAVVGAVIAIYILIQNHRAARRFLNGVVVVSWVLLVLSAGFLALLVWAVVNFE